MWFPNRHAGEKYTQRHARNYDTRTRTSNSLILLPEYCAIVFNYNCDCRIIQYNSWKRSNVLSNGSYGEQDLYFKLSTQLARPPDLFKLVRERPRDIPREDFLVLSVTGSLKTETGIIFASPFLQHVSDLKRIFGITSRMRLISSKSFILLLKIVLVESYI